MNMSFFDFFNEMYEVSLGEFKALLEVTNHPEPEKFLKTIYNDYCSNKTNKSAEYLIHDFLNTDYLYFE